jgi:hypothetical protein
VLELYAASGDRVGEASTWDSAGCARHHLGHYEAAVHCCEESRALHRQAGVRYAEAEVPGHLGDTYEGDTYEADTYEGAGDPRAASRARRRTREILEDLDHPDAPSPRPGTP